MTDSISTPSVDTAPAAPAAAPETVSAVGGETAPGAANGSNEQQTVHPAWDDALKSIPEYWQKPLRETIQNTEREHQAALERARQESTPEEWRTLLAQAREAGVKPEDLQTAYNGQLDLQEQLRTDPDGFLADVTSFIEREAAAGRITRRQAAQAQQAANQAAADANDDLFQTDEQRQLAELKSWKEQQEQLAEQQAEQQRQQEQDQLRQQEAEQFADTFFGEFKQQMADAGLATVGADGSFTGTLPKSMVDQIAYSADAILDANPNLTVQQGVQAAVQQFKDWAASAGVQLAAPAAQQRSNIPPVIGGSATTPSAPPAAAPAAGSDERSSAAVAAINAALGRG